MQPHLAQINIARFRPPMAHPANRAFIDSLDRVNATAEAQAGFVWRLTGNGDNALAAFGYRSEAHRGIMRRRREWFDPLEVHMALWWVPARHRPAVTEGVERLDWLRDRSPTAGAFDFRHPFPPPDGAEIAPTLDPCTGASGGRKALSRAERPRDSRLQVTGV